jgi:hypothetical protein
MELNNFKLSMNLISREELKEKLDRGDKFKLVNALGEWAFNAKHIPGSINISNMQDAKKMLDADGRQNKDDGRLIRQIKDDIEDAYAKGKISERHYKLLNKKIESF